MSESLAKISTDLARKSECKTQVETRELRQSGHNARPAPSSPTHSIVINPGHSLRRMAIGFAFVARLAGIWQARRAVIRNSAGTNAKVAGSQGWTPNSEEASSLLNASAEASPMSRPTTTSSSACLMISPATCILVAPSAIRIPISVLRCITEYASNP
jgi:hypothetical protein